MQHAQYVLLFLVLVVNSNRLHFYEVILAARSYALLACVIEDQVDQLTLGDY